MSLPQFQRSKQIRQDWQRTMDTALEAGQVALLEWGASRRQLSQLPTLATYQQWHMARGDVTQPVMLVGGLDTTWPIPLLLAPIIPATHAGGAPPVQLTYSGADQATYLAAMTTQATNSLPAGAFYTVDLPTAMQPLLAPMTQPHAHMAWHTLPLALLFAAYDDRATHLDFPPQVSSRQPANIASPPVDLWLAWSALSIVIVLILLALVTP